MQLKYNFSFLIMPVILIMGCSTHRVDEAWPKPRPLGSGITTYRPSQEPAITSSGTPKVEEATGVITLPQALALALMHNPELAVFSWEVRAGEARTLQAGLFPNPEVEIEMEGIGEKSAEAPLTPTNTLRISQLVELGGKRSKRARVVSLERDLAGWDYEAKRLDVLTGTIKDFIEVLTAQERLGVTQELVRLAETVLNTVSERVTAGKVSPLEEVKAKANLAMVKIELEQARRNLEASRKRLAANWGSISAGFEKAAGQFEAMAQVPSAEKIADLISQNPDIARWDAEIARRQTAVKLEEANRLPDLTLSAGLQSVRGRNNAYSDTAYVVGMSIPLPLFNRNQGGILEAEYNLTKAREEQKCREVQTRTALTETYQALAAAFASATALKNEVLPAVQRAFDASNEGYRQGKFGYLDVLDAQRTLFEARRQYIESLSAYHKAVADMERLIGDKLN